MLRTLLIGLSPTATKTLVPGAHFSMKQTQHTFSIQHIGDVPEARLPRLPRRRRPRRRESRREGRRENSRAPRGHAGADGAAPATGTTRRHRSLGEGREAAVDAPRSHWRRRPPRDDPSSMYRRLPRRAHVRAPLFTS